MSTESETSTKPKRRALGKGLGALLPAKKAPTQAPSLRAKPSGTIPPVVSEQGAQSTQKTVTQKPATQKTVTEKTAQPPVATKAKETLSNQAAKPTQSFGITKTAKPSESYFKVPVEEIHPSPEQPRRVFAPEKLSELAQSIKEHGVIQPLIVRKRGLGGYFLIAGERRWRACQKAGILDIPVVVQSVTEKQAFERAIVENVQRDDLNVIEEAEAYQRLMSEHGLTQDNVALRVGKKRSTVANAIRLLKLPHQVREMVENDTLSMGHARALLSLDAPQDILKKAKQVKSERLSVRQLEKLIKDTKSGTLRAKAAAPKKEKSAAVRDLENRLSKALGAPVLVSSNKKNSGGKIEVTYADLDDLDRLIDQFSGYSKS